ncbi:hypothetical protein MJO29_009814 [Puccinia striiformis f. sp. tritici]|nr:hypothetical protein MJO29_009814 [Puccinia striiformis f. sp. tritici]
MFRSKETPFERRERLNLEQAIALSTSSSNMTSQIQSALHDGAINPPKSPHVIPNSQSDEEIIQDFTLEDLPTSSKRSPPTTIILPVQSSSMDPGLAAVESRGPGWSMNKFRKDNSSAADQSTHLKPNLLTNSSSSTRQSPEPLALAAPSSASTNNSSAAPRIKPRPPRVGAASIEQARERLKLREYTDSSTNPMSSSTIEQSLKDPFHPTRIQSKPPKVLQQPKSTPQNVSEQTPAPNIEISLIQKPPDTPDRPLPPQLSEVVPPSNRDGPSRQAAPDPPAQQSKKKRKLKTQETPEAEPLQVTEKTKADGDGKRVRKQSAVGKASAKSLQILLNLSQSSDEAVEARSKPQPPAIIENSNKSQRRRFYRNGWVLASDPEPEPEPDNRSAVPVVGAGEDQPGSAHQPPNQNLAPPPAPCSKDASSQPFLEIVSSPLSSASGFSADEMALKASKRSKPSPVPKKQAPRKKAAPKPKVTKKQKQAIEDPPEDANLNATSVALEQNPGAGSIPNTTSSAHNNLDDNHDPPMGLKVPGETDKPRSPLPAPQSKARPSPCQTAGASSSSSRDLNLIKTPATNEAVPVIDEPGSMSSKAAPPPAEPPPEPTKGIKQPITDTGGGKKRAMMARKRMSLSEILAATNPKTKRGLRIGLPREEKHRLLVNINPNPPVQKQVKKKLRVKRGEYDSGEDDPRSNKSGSDASDAEIIPSQSKKTLYPNDKNCQSDQDLDDKDHEDVKTNNLDLDEDYS